MKLIVLLFIFPLSLAFGQQGSVRGSVVDDKTGETLLLVKVIVKRNDDQIVKGVETDFEGNFHFQCLEIGSYNIHFKADIYGMDEYILENVIVQQDAIVNLGKVKLKQIEIIGCDFGYELQPNPIQIDPFGRSTIIKKEEIRRY